MLKDITLGQFFPGNTIAHRLDPRTKLILVVVYIVALFQTSGRLSERKRMESRCGFMSSSRRLPEVKSISKIKSSSGSTA